jgi:hypothetical protein
MFFFTGTLQSQMLNPVEPITMAVKGFVISLQGDSLFGKVAVTGMKYNCVSKINFTSEDGTKTAYTPDQLQGFGQKRPAVLVDFSDLTSISQHWVIYESCPHPTKEVPVFLQRLMDGKIKVFENPSAMQSSTQIGGFTVDKGSGNYFVEKAGASPVKIDKKTWDQSFPSLFSDCDSFTNALQQHPEWKEFKKMPYAVDYYNMNCR